MSNAVTPKPERFEEEVAKLDLAPTILRGNSGLASSRFDSNECEARIGNKREAAA